MEKNLSSETKFLLDSTSLADGRVVSLFENNILKGKVFVPRISYEIARENSTGRNSMAALQRLDCGLSIQPMMNGLSEIDEIITVAKELKARIITASNLVNSRADKNGLPIINIKELFKSLLPRAAPGDIIRVRIIKRGKGSGEGVGYLEFGVKVVVNRAGDRIGKEVAAIVKNALTTPSGMVLFAELA